MCDKCEIYEIYLRRIAACKHNPDPFGYLPALASEALDEAAQQSMHPTAFLAWAIVFVLGFMCGAKYVLYRLGGG